MIYKEVIRLHICYVLVSEVTHITYNLLLKECETTEKRNIGSLQELYGNV